MDGAGLIAEWTPAASRLFGWAADEALGRRLSELIIPARQRAAHEAGLERFLQGGRGALLDRPLEITVLHRDGHEFGVSVRIGSEKTADGYRFPAWIDPK
jgi:PAS domain S-box-containing protein